MAGSGTDANLKIESDWVEIFEAGEYPQGKYTEKDLDEVVSTYDPSFHEAPAVIGHPKTTAPAYAWVKELKREGTKLLAWFRQVNPEFAEWVRQGLWKKRSIRLSRNYVPGKLYLKDVGWLGAEPPQIKGLADVAFRSDDEDVVVEFTDTNAGGNEMDEKKVQELLAKQRQELEGAFAEREKKLLEQMKGSQDAAFAEMKEREKELLSRLAAVAGGGGDDKGGKAAEGATLEDVVKRQEAAFAEMKERETKRDKENAELRRKIRRTEIDTRLGKLEAAGKITPAMMNMGLVEFAEALDESTEVEFGESGKKTNSQFFFDFLEKLPEVVPFNALATKGKAGAGSQAGDAEFAEADAVDEERMELHRKTVALSREKGISYQEALQQIKM